MNMPPSLTACFAFTLFTCALNALVASSWQEHDSRQGPFTVADSIEMVHIIDPSEHTKGAHAQFSPRRDRFFIVTEKGNLNSNLRDYSLFVYKINELDKPDRVAIFRSSSNRPGISQAKWLSDARISLIGENPDEVPQVYVVDLRPLKIRKLTSAPLGIEAYDATQDLTTVVYSSHLGSDETQNKYRDQHGFAIADIDVGCLSDLTSEEWKRQRNGVQTYVVNTSSGKTVRVQETPASPVGGFHLWLSPDGQYAITERPVISVPESWASYEDEELGRKIQAHYVAQAMLVHGATGEIEPLITAPVTDVFSVVWSSDSRSVVVSGTYLPLQSDQPAELDRRKLLPVVADVTLPGRSFRRIADIPKGQVWSLERGDDTDTLLVHARELVEGDNLKVLPTLVFRRTAGRWLDESEARTLSTNPTVVVVQSLNDWPKLVLIDPATHQEKLISDPNPQFQHRRFGRVQNIRWVGKLSESWVGALVYPTDYKPGQRYPLVIQTHDYDPEQFLLDGPYTTAMAAQELANKGIAVLQIGEGPLHDPTEGKPAEGPANQSGFESAIDYLDGLGIVDRKRVGLIGFSRTAYHAKYALTHSHYHFAAATAAEGIDFGYWMYIAVYGNSLLGQREYTSLYGGIPWRDNWKPWMEHSVSFNFDKIHTPLRLEANSTCSIIAEWETFTALRLLKKPVDLIYIPHGAHPLVKPWERMASQQGNVDWFTFWLRNEEDPDPEKTEQYTRWHELRKLQNEDARQRGESIGSGNP